ncbi:MAG: selenocysteine-specific translation elongation factor, partial [Deltaproteobacteria bacterium]|nr:selenocysteine-specific translation elongation factor [Deltaproteobacteria bacterium]
DADRLEEEKRRGITIVNGYAPFDLGNGERASIIDVPGHERFVRHMLAGSGAVDLSLLTVAADDGVMPQTVEHLHILSLLGVRRAIVALTKCDLAPDSDWLDLVAADISSLTEGFFDAPPPVIKVSVVTGQGIGELEKVLREEAQSVPPKELQGRFRLPVDRVFTMTGFGTVVTGSLLEGTAAAGQPAQVYPSGLEAKIRQVQVHSNPVDAAYPGQRSALNISNLRKEDLARGDVVATPGTLTPSMMLDASLLMLPRSFFQKPQDLKTGRLVKLHLAAREIPAKLALIEGPKLSPGERAFAQLRLLEPAVARKGDRFVIRQPSPALTLGGGEILDAAPLKRRPKPETAAIFRTKESGAHLERVELAVRERPGSFEPFAKTILRADLDRTRARAEANILADRGVLAVLGPDLYIHSTEKAKIASDIKIWLKDYHRDNPYSPGASLEEVRARLLPGAPPSAAESLFSMLVEEGVLTREGGSLRLKSFEPRVDEEGRKYASSLEEAYLDFGLNPPANSAVLPETAPELTRRRKMAFYSLARQGRLIPLDDLYHVHADHFERAWRVFSEMAAAGPVQIGPFRDALKSSRKVALALLDSFDRLGRSFRFGEGRLPRL